MRPGSLRRMHRYRRQAGRSRLHHLGFRRGRPGGYDHRRPSPDRGSRGSEGLAPAERPTMRGLPGSPAHAGRGPPHRKSKAQSRPDTRSDVRQHLPLRRLSTHRKRRASRIDGGVTMNILTNPKKLRGFERHIKVDNVSRRSILKGLGLAGGFVLAAPVMSRPGFAAYQTGADKMPHGTVVDPRVFVAIAPDGMVTIGAHRAEMGTGVRTSLPLIVAEEMEADWSRVRVQQAHGDEVKFGNQDTDGSRSTRHYLIPMRQSGASARSMLEAAAAKRWGVPVIEVKAANHEVVHAASGRRIGFGDSAMAPPQESCAAI